MKNILLLFGMLFFGATNLSSQDLRTTYPIDSCIWFMTPYQFRIQQTFQQGNYQGNVTLFRSTSNPDLVISGKGRFIISLDELPTGVTIKPQDQGQLLLTVPEPPDGFENWPGGQPPFPLMIYGFLQSIEGTVIDPPIPITLRVSQLFFEDTTQ